ncbi:MAG TPA: hypothetical protein VGM81_13625 [Burkholderiaceae bacterium]
MAASKYIHTLFLGLTGLALWHWQSEARRQRQLQHKLAAGKHAKAAVPTWEAEGGALAETGSQIGSQGGPEPRKS